MLLRLTANFKLDPCSESLTTARSDVIFMSQEINSLRKRKNLGLRTSKPAFQVADFFQIHFKDIFSINPAFQDIIEIL